MKSESTKTELNESNDPKVRIFLLDDHEIVRHGVANLLESTGKIEVVGDAGTISDARNRIKLSNPQVAILDIQLPDGDGIQFCREISENYSDINSLILTSYADDQALLAAVLAGAKGFVAKQIKSSLLIDAVLQVASGKTLLKQEEIDRVKSKLESHDPRLDLLTEQEKKILHLLTEGLTNREIANRLYLAEKTVKNYVSNLLMKMGFSRRTEAAVWATKHSV
jgi:DNA-binding NarL/FixJ family response regulator